MSDNGVPVCSIIVPLFNRSVYTRIFLNCLRPVLPASIACEVIMVDSGSTDDTRDVLNELGGSYRTVSLETNRNFSGACNAGAAVAAGRFLYFLNNDTVPLAGFVEPLVAELELHADVGIVGSKLLFPDGTIQHAGIAIDRYGIPTHIYLRSPADAEPVNRRRELQAVTGASLMIRRDDFQAVGGFDELFRNSHEDVDLCLRVRERGRKVVYCPGSTLYHFESASPGRHDHEERNLTLFLARWHDRSVSDQEQIYVGDNSEIPPRRLADSATELVCALHREQDIRTHWQQRAHALAIENESLISQIATLPNDLPKLAEMPRDRRVAVLNVQCPSNVVAGEPVQIGLLVATPTGAVLPTRLNFTFECSRRKLSHSAGSVSVSRPGLQLVAVEVSAPLETGTLDLCVRTHEHGRLLARLPVQLRPRYGVRYRVMLPAELVAGTVGKYPFALDNLGGEVWEGTGRLQLGYRWTRPDGRGVVEFDGRAAILNRRVLPGGQVNLIATLHTPANAGSYILSWDLVEEGVSWYSNRGVEPRHDKVELRPAAPSPPEQVDDATFDSLMRHSRRLRDQLAVAESSHDRLAAKVAEFEAGIEWLRSEVRTEKQWREEALAKLAKQESESANMSASLTESLRERDEAAAKLRQLQQTRAVRWSSALRALVRRRP